VTVLNGQCQCGRVRVAFTTADPAALKPRACQCSFCRRHGSHTVSDPAGKVVISADEGDIHRHRFALRVTDFLVCTHCGVYVGAVARVNGTDYASINAVGVDFPELATREAVPFTFDAETREEREARRLKSWTPAVVVERPRRA
jgi:hypothetical protein